jgi:hypothetical protein
MVLTTARNISIFNAGAVMSRNVRPAVLGAGDSFGFFGFFFDPP